MTIASAVAECMCGWHNEITVADAFNDDPVRSAEQSCRGHVSASEDCSYDQTNVDVIHG